MKKSKYLTKGLMAAAALAVALIVMLAFAHESHTAAVASATVAPAAPVVNNAAYPLDYCVVSGEKLDEMGDPVVKMYGDREVKFCCDMCVKKFEKDKAKYSKKLNDAIIAAQKSNYPMGTCVVSGEPLIPSEMGDPVDYVYQNRLVRFCCNHCTEDFTKNPDKFLQKLDAALAAKVSPGSEQPAEPSEVKE